MNLQTSGAAGPEPAESSGGVFVEPDSLLSSVDVEVAKTLLISDLVGSTELIARLGNHAAAALFWQHDRVARDLISAYDGREVDKSDGFLLLFEQPLDAVFWALAYHRALEQLAATEGVDLQARVGIHLGEVILHVNPLQDVARGAKPIEVEGLAKPMAARLMSLARGRQTLLSRRTFKAARQALAAADEVRGLRWIDHGRYRFKGFDEENDIFEVGVTGLSPMAPPEDSEKAYRVAAGGSWQERLRPRHWPPPELPELPYPLLLPYTHPALLAGRERDLAEIERLLHLPLLALGLCAASGAGKTSLLWGALAPHLRAAGRPVAFNRHPHEPDLPRRLLGDLVEPDSDVLHVAEEDGRAFVERLLVIGDQAGTVPVLIVDQLETLLGQGDHRRARAVLGMLLAASAERRPGLAAPPCRWLLAYRQEHHGAVIAWLGDVLADARGEGFSRLDGLPHDLSTLERFQGIGLAPLGTPPPGADPVAEATRVFQTVIETPLALRRANGTRRYAWRFADQGARRLARAFAEARVARPDAPLTPELQVVLAHLAETSGTVDADTVDAGDEVVIEVPEDPGRLIDEALEEHVRRALEEAFPAGASDASEGRSCALLALRELADAMGQRKEGLPATVLTRAVGARGDEILEKLATPSARLVTLRKHPDGWRYVLSHDRLAEVVVRMVEQEGQHGRLIVDGELLALRRFVMLNSALYSSQEAPVTPLTRRRYRRIAAHADALLWTDEHRDWWAACQRRRRIHGLRSAALTLFVALALGAVASTAWRSAHRRANLRALYEQVSSGAPSVALRGFEQLIADPRTDLGEVRARLRQRPTPLDLLENGLDSIEVEQRGPVVLRLVEVTLPLLTETFELSQRLRLVGTLTWALDFFPGRDPAFATDAWVLRQRVLEDLRQQRPPPWTGADDPEWVAVPGGRFRSGADGRLGGADDGREIILSPFRMLVHEVTNADYRRLVADHPGADTLPVVGVNWYEAYAYAAWLNGRLPTEAEWEYAARAGCRYAYCDRDGNEVDLDAVAWYHDNALDPVSQKLVIHPVKQRQPNPWGLYDLYGNVYEWSFDWHAEGREAVAPGAPPLDPAGPLVGQRRVMRGGGSWDAITRMSEERDGWPPGNTSVDLGFRIVLPPLPPSVKNGGQP